MVDPRGPDAVAGQLLNVHIGAGGIREHGNNPGGVVYGKHLGIRIIIKIAVELFNQGGTVVQQQFARAIGIKKQLITAYRGQFILQGVPLLVSCAVGAAADILLTAPMAYERRVGVLALLARSYGQ